VLGSIYTSRWHGDYVVTCTDPLRIKSLSRENAFIVRPNPEYFVATERTMVMGSGGLPVASDPANGMGNRTETVRRRRREVAHPSEVRAEIVASDGDALSAGASERRRLATDRSADTERTHPEGRIGDRGIAGSTPVTCTVEREQLVVGAEPNPQGSGSLPVEVAVASISTFHEQLAIDTRHERTLGAYRSALSLAWVPSRDDVQVWTPCLTRSTIGDHVNKTHAYFIAPFVRGSLYCPECRARKPRTLYYRDGELVHDSHHDVVSAQCLWFRHEAETPAPEFADAGLSRHPELDALARGDADVESSASALLAMTAAREEGVPPAPSDAKETPAPPAGSPSPFPADDPKISVGSFERPTSPIGRAWRGLWEWKEWCAERAAIIEYNAGMTRKIAESMTRTLAGPAPRA
jgi:hypothetical protein